MKFHYFPFIAIISFSVSLLIHFPETVSLFDIMDATSIFPDIKMWEVINEVLFTFISLILLFWINTVIFHFNQPAVKITWVKILLSLLITWVLSGILGKLFVFLHKTFDIPAIDAMLHHYLHPLRDIMISCTVTGSCYIIYLIRRQQEVLIENERLQAENILGQYEVLKNQLNPHMLFNSLNTLGSLVRENKDKAIEYIQKLSKVLRYTLQDNETKSITLGEEMNFVSSYNFLLLKRFEDNLIFDININPIYDKYFVPPMAIYLLVENAVKHNEISSKRPLKISIYTTDNNEITVSNPIQPKLTSTSGTGIGLANLSKRYKLLFQKEISIVENTNFSVTIPLIPNNHN
jgi:hypothetical protein